jgi:iron complex outermembrane receptor protein
MTTKKLQGDFDHMATRTYRHTRAFAIAVLAALSGAASAQSTTQSPGLEEIIVTAQKREQNINDVGIAITAFDSKTIEALGYHQLSDVSGATSNFSVVMMGTNVPDFTIRGVGVNDYALNQSTSVGTYVDGVAMSSPALMNVQMFDTDGVEVLKGPQGTLYGRNTIGGAVLFTSKGPTDTFQASTYDEIGNYGYYMVGGAISGPLSDTVSARLAFNDTQSNGYQKDLTTGNTNGGLDQVNVRSIFDWKPTNDLKVRLKLYAGADNSNLDAFNLPGQGGNTSTYGTINTPDGIPYRRSKADGGALTADWKLGGVTLTSITGYDHLNRFEYTNIDGRPACCSVSDETINSIEQSQVNQVSQELRAASSSNGPLTWVAGLYWSHDEIQDYTDYLLPGAGYSTAALGIPSTYPVATSLGNKYDQKTTSEAAFGQVEWSPTEKWHLTAGLRYTKDSKQLDNATTTWTVNPEVDQGAAGAVAPVQSGEFFAPISLSKDFSAVTGKIGVDYHLSKDALFYASVSNGFKSGGFQGQLATNPAGIDAFGNETLTAYETGLKLTLAGGRVQVNSALFYYVDNGLQADGILKIGTGGNAALYTMENVGNARDYGAEIDLQAKPTEQLTLALGVGYLSAKIVQPLVTDVPVNGKPALSPEWTANGRARYDIVETSKARWFVQGDFRCQASEYFDIYETQFLHESAYCVVNGGLGVNAIDDKWQVMLYGRNIADRTYRVFGYSGGTAGNVSEYGPPRTYGVSFSYHFE